MSMASRLSTWFWFMLLFLLVYGLTELMPFFRPPWAEGLFAVGAAIFLFLDM
jgi:hypothetical protein